MCSHKPQLSCGVETGLCGVDGASGLRFPRLRHEDLPMLAEWLALRHISRWWNDPHDLASVTAKYGPRIDGQRKTNMHLIVEHERPIGWLQWYLWRDFPDHAAKLGLGEDAAGLDLAIGEASAIGRGVGARTISVISGRLFDAFRQVNAVACDPEVLNRRSVRAFEKAGFRRIRELTVAGESVVRVVMQRERNCGVIPCAGPACGAPERARPYRPRPRQGP